MSSQRLDTPTLLKAARATILALTGLLLIAILYATTVHRAAMQTVGKDTAPSIIAAQHIKAALADMDADAANELLDATGTTTTIDKAYEARRVEASNALVAAAGNITYGDSERLPIQTIASNLSVYERLFEHARDLRDQDTRDQDPRDLTRPATAAAYEAAAALMDHTLLPAADALDEANSAQLEHTYSTQSTHTLLARLLLILAAALLLLTLVATQVYLSQRMHRTLNPLLLLATLLTAGITFVALRAMSAEQHHLKVAKEDAFTSIHALWRARAIAYEANSDESRFLLDPAAAAQHQRAFETRSRALAALPTGMTPDQVVAAEARGESVANFTGYLADELNNITFTGERAAATRTLAAFEAYQQVDARLRTLETTHQHREAIALCVGSAPGQSDWAFTRVDDALSQTLQLNEDAFRQSVEQGFKALDHLELIAAIILIAAAILTFIALATRLREYQ